MENHFDRQLKVFSIIVSALGVIYGIIFAYESARDLILLIPAITLALGFRFQSESYGVETISEYLRRLENKMKFEIPCETWKGYQTYWTKNHSKWKMLVYDVVSKEVFLQNYFIFAGLCKFRDKNIIYVMYIFRSSRWLSICRSYATS